MQTNTVFQYTNGELELVLTNNEFYGEFKWEFPQDVKENAKIIRTEIFRYGNHYGVLKRNDRESKSSLKFNGETWYLITKYDCKPFLENTNPNNPDKSKPTSIMLQEVYKSMLKTSPEENFPQQLKLEGIG